MSASPPPTAPAPGSHPYFAWLYTPSARREELTTLLALTDEIGSHPATSIDHGVAHARLEWWRSEAGRFTRGTPEHPWLRALLREHPRTASLDLQPLVDGAEQDLAARTLNRGGNQSLRRALFAVAARTLCDGELTPSVAAAAGELGAAVQKLERNPRDEEARAALPPALQSIGAAHQPPLAPLLVWLALAVSTMGRRGRLRRALADNFVAWSAARRAARGRFRLDS